jgi:nucleotide-sensitive chloride channel 1A
VGVLGTLYITTRRFVWIGQDAAHDFDAGYIVLHAVTHDTESYPFPCLYCQLDEEDEDTEQEVFFVPADEATLQALFQAFSHVAMLNPDMDMDEDEGGMGSNLIYNLDEVELGAEEARRLAQFESVFVEPSYGDSADQANPTKIRRRGGDDA